MVIFIRQSIVTLLILLQLVAPLLHAHSGVELSHDRLHLPGLETVDIDSSGIQILELNSHNEVFNVLVGVCTGFNQVKGIAEIDHETPFIPSVSELITAFRLSGATTVLQSNSPPLNQSIKTNSPRAPPILTS